MLCWVHFGELHASDEDGWGSVDDLAALVADVGTLYAGTIDFAYLPGDIANHGTPEQYARVRASLVGLTVPWFAIPGDHDFAPGSLANFYAGLGVADLPMVVSLDDRRCLFLDLVSAGHGGPDFRLGASQTAWLRQQLEQAWAEATPAIVFMHAVPGDLATDAETIGQMSADRDVVCVDTGHTHYNELLNDGRVVYTATRSTGQIEEGPVGASFHAVDGTVVSMRFTDDTGRIDIRVSRLLVAARASVGDLPSHDRHSVGAWADHGFLGTQLGPNKNGRKW